MNRIWKCTLAAAVTGLAAAVAGAQTVGPDWTIVVGSAPLERVAGEDLKSILAERDGVTLRGPVAAAEFKGDGPAIVIGTPDTNPRLSDQPFITGAPSEAYHLLAKGQSLLISGPSSKGAMNGVYRFVDRHSLEITGLDEQKAPVFVHRVGGHKMNQSPPADWSEQDQARYYARHYINIVWGEKHGPPMSLESRRKYGLGLMVEMKFPPFIDQARDWMDDPKYASAVYYWKKDEDRRVADPFDPAGREAYLKAYQQLLSANPDTRILYALFGDYSVIPSPDSIRISDGKPYPHTRVETMQQIMGIMREAMRQANLKDAVALAWLWHGFFGEPKESEQHFMAWLRDNGYGMLYNEAGNNDNWLIRRDNFNETALLADAQGKSVWGPNYHPLVSAGGACESVNPVIGMPLPAVAAHKLKRLVDAGVGNVVLWWGSAEGWVYNPNIEVLARMTWTPEQYQDEKDPLNPADPDPLLKDVAADGFGASHATQILDYWRTFDHALVTQGPLYKPVDDQPPADQDGLHINDWYQRMGIFTETVFSQEFARPLTPESLANHKAARKGTYWGTADKTLANYQHVTQGLQAAQDKLAAVRKQDLSPRAAENARQMFLWAELYRTLLNSQQNYLRALRAVHGHAGDPVEPGQVTQRIQPVIDDELANIDQMIGVLKQLPANANIRQPHEGVVSNRGSTEQEIASLRDKAVAMKMVGKGQANLALNCPVTASSVKTEKGQTFEARFATDGDPSTRWASTFDPQQWIAIDLGQPKTFSFVRIYWKNAYPSDFEIEVADEADPRQWKVVYHATSGGGGVSVIAFDRPVTARAVRMKANKPATDWGYSIEEFQVLGE